MMVDASVMEKARTDEQRVARAVALGLPVLTIATAAVVAVMIGPATSILVLTAGLLLGVIALLWGSLRILSGDAPLSPELEALEMAAQGADALSNRKIMLLRTLKDLETDRGIGKIEAEDFDQIAATYRAELKVVLKRIDDSLAPRRERAEAIARAHLAKRGMLDDDGDAAEKSVSSTEHSAPKKAIQKRTRRNCEGCGASNETDAKFCKECGETFAREENSSRKQAVVAAEVPDED